MQKLIIYRPWWYRGYGPCGSRLLQGYGTERPPAMCCLGQFAISCGIDRRDITHVGTPGGMAPSSGNLLPEPLRPKYTLGNALGENTAVTRALVRANDDPTLTAEARENELKKLFAEAGVEVEFTDELPEYLSKAFPESCKA